MEPEIIRFEDVIKGCILKWKTIVVFSILTTLLALGLSLTIKETISYEGNFKVLITYKDQYEVEPEFSQKLIRNYMVTIKTNNFVKSALENASLEDDYLNVISKLTVTDIPNTDFLNINYKGTNKENTKEVLLALKDQLGTYVDQYSDYQIILNEDIEVLEVKTSPNRKLFLAGGLLGGAFLSLGLTFVLECINNTFKTKGELERETKKRIIGNIPKFKGGNKEKYYEYYNQLATNLKLSKEADNKVITVTSSVDKEGVSEVVIGLAKSLSNFSKVIVIDGNFRNPNFNKLFNDNDSVNTLDNYLLGKIKLEKILKNSGKLDYIITNKSDKYMELLTEENLREFFEVLRSKYDYVIIDGAAMKLSAGAKIFAEQSESTLLVVKAESTKKNTVKEVITDIENININLLGLIFNYGDTFRNKYEVY